MKIRHGQTTDVATAELGRRLREHRVARRLTQEELGLMAGLDRRTVANLENGGDANLASFIMVLRALGRFGDLDQLMPEPKEAIDPFEVLKRARGKRTRVRKRRQEEKGDGDG